jgi:hypothetical protein
VPKAFHAQSLSETKSAASGRHLELTFIDANGGKQTISLPTHVAANLAGVLASLSASGASSHHATRFTKMPKLWAVGRAAHERFVLLRFDDDPPYALDVEEAEHLWREVRDEAENASRMPAPVRQ